VSQASLLFARFSGLIPRLPRSAWLLLAGMFTGWLAGGFVMAFLIIYLHFVRGVSLGTAGIALALVAAGGALVSPLVGSLTDRFGARRLLTVMLAVGAAGAVSLAAVRTPWQAMLATFIYGIGLASLSGPEYTLLATVVPRAKRSAAFALQYSAVTLGISIGALLGGLAVDIERPQTFELAFVACAVPYAVYAILLSRVTVLADATTAVDEPDGAGYRRDLPDWILRSIDESGGKALVLFTSAALMRAVADMVRTRIEARGYRLLVQGADGERHAILEEFRRDVTSVLFGLDSFWMGVEGALYGLIDRPDFMAQLVRRIVQGNLHLLDQLEDQGCYVSPSR